MCSSIAHPVPFETVSLANSAALDGQEAPEILQPLPVQHWDYRSVLLFFFHVGAKNANSGYHGHGFTSTLPTKSSLNPCGHLRFLSDCLRTLHL